MDVGEGIRTKQLFDLGTIQFSFFFYRDIGADNQVSCTVTFDPEKEGDQIPHVLNYYQYHLKGISLLRHDYGLLIHKWHESVSRKEYDKQVKKLGKLFFWCDS